MRAVLVVCLLASEAVAQAPGDLAPTPAPTPTPTPAAPPVYPPAAPPTYQPGAPPTYQPAAPPTHQPAAPPTYQPAAPPTHQPAAPPTHQPAAPPTYQPAAPPTYQPPYQPAATERSDRGLVALGGVLGGGGPSDWFYGAWVAEGAVTLVPGRTLGVRARGFLVLAGGTVESDWAGDFSRIGAGLEARTCTAGQGGCLFVDLDAGYQGLTLDDHSGDFVRSDKGVLVGPRFGVDLGGAVRVRFALETYRMFARHVDARTSEARAFGTLGLSLALGYQI